MGDPRRDGNGAVKVDLRDGSERERVIGGGGRHSQRREGRSEAELTAGDRQSITADHC